MKPSIKILFLLFYLTSGTFLKAQDNYERFTNAMKDSAFTEANYYFDKMYTPFYYTADHVNMKLSFLIKLNEWDSMCSFIRLYKNLGYSHTFGNAYHSAFCETDKDKIPKEFKKLYAQRNQFNYNNYITTYTNDDSLRGSDNSYRKCFDVGHYNLDLRFNTKNHSISGKSIITFRWKAISEKIQIDAHKDLSIDSILILNRKIPFFRQNNIIFINQTDSFQIGNIYSVTIFYHGTPKDALNPPWEGGFVWKKNKSSKIWAGVACEHLGASYWWPNKDFPGDEPDSMSLNFEVEKPYKVISNGNLIKQSVTRDNFNRFSWEVKNPINNYNATFYIGNFIKVEKEYIDVNDVKQTLKFYTMEHNKDKALDYFSLSVEVLKFYEKAFGEFPFWKDGYALVESPFAGMEHQSAIAIGPDYGKIKKDQHRYSAVKDDYLIIHETAHEWWGNSVTANDMADAWLQEGFATYSEYMFIENKYGPLSFISELNMRRYEILNKWPLLGNRGVNDNAFIGGDIYSKGAMLLQNIRFTLDNDSVFFAILKNFAVENRHKTVSTETFIEFTNRASGKDLSKLFEVYLKQTTIPTLEYYIIISKTGNKEFRYKWTNVPDGFSMPLVLKLNNITYNKFQGTTEEKYIEFLTDDSFDFVGGFMNYKGCPANYYSHYNTRKVTSGKKQD